MQNWDLLNTDIEDKEYIWQEQVKSIYNDLFLRAQEQGMADAEIETKYSKDRILKTVAQISS